MRKYGITVFIMLLFAVSLFGSHTRKAEAASVTGVEAVDQVTPGSSGTDIEISVAVDYMGKLAFWVHDKETEDPIEGASVELWIPSLDRYVLFGMTDKKGYYEVDVAYAESGEDYRDQYSQDGTKFTGILLRFPGNKNIKWKVYKSGWLEYPTEGVIEELNTQPKISPATQKETWVHDVFVKLWKEEEETEPDTNFRPKEKDPGTPPGSGSGPGTKYLPKTGLQTQLSYLGAGLLMLLAASGLLVILLRRNIRDEAESGI